MSAAADTAQVQIPLVTGGVDTHQLTHHAALLDSELNQIADREFAATSTGYQELVDWMAGYGRIAVVGVESTGSYGAGLTRHLLAAGIEVVEVSGPEKATRVKQGKSDPIDAYCAARQVATGAVTGRAKVTTGIVEAIRMIKIPRDAAVRDRTRAYSQLRDLITTAPAPIHDELIAMTGHQRARRAAAYRPDPNRIHEPLQAAKQALRALAHRIGDLDAEIAAADKTLNTLTKQAVPSLLAMRQVGPQTSAQLLITAGENIDRMRTEATFAKLVGVAPLPASSGKTRRHRLNRGGDRHANSAL
ncbi:MAG: family transposase, partial [Frankiales bacterium]|nr:family transposase [Frankiales bacterium]